MHRPSLTLPPQAGGFFDAGGTLREDLPFTWAVGMPSHVQTAFAREGLVVRIPLDRDEDGSGVVLAGRAGNSDLCRIAQSFRLLEEVGYIAEPDFAFTNSGAWQDVHERSGSDGKAIFWNSQAHVDCFDDEGALIDDIPLQWSGDAEVIEAALRECGLVVDAPETPEITFFLGPEGEDEF